MGQGHACLTRDVSDTACGVMQSQMLLRDAVDQKLKQYVCWVQILELMGGEHAGISEAAKGLHNIEITGPSNPSEKREKD